MRTLVLVLALLGSITNVRSDVTVDWLKQHVTPILSERVRGEFVDWFEPPASKAPPGANRYNFFGSQLRAGFRLDVPYVSLTVVGQDTQFANLPDDANGIPGIGNLGPGANYFALSPHYHNDNTDAGEVFLKEGWLHLHGAPWAEGLALDGGRFQYSDGLETVPKDATLSWLKRNRIAERLVGPFGYTQVTRSFDGLRLVFDQPLYNLTAVAVHPTDGGYEISANREIGDIDVAGLAATVRPLGDIVPSDARLFYLFYRDDRFSQVDVPPVKVDNRPLAVRQADTQAISIQMTGAHFLTAVPAGPGTFDLLLWGVLQWGAWGEQRHSAWAYAMESGYQLRSVRWAPWVRVGYDHASGDDDPNDGLHRTFFQVLPTARIYALFPFYNLMNVEDRLAELILTPHERVGVRTTWHWLRLTESQDLWYSGGGANNDNVFGFSGIAANDHHNLAQLVDIGVTVTILKQLTAYVYYGHAFGQGVVRQSFSGADANYAYLEMTFQY